MSRLLILTCCVCGERAPAYKHWYNRDQGYGLCGQCAALLQRRPDYDPQEFTTNYGREGVHWIALPEPSTQ